MLIPNFLPPNEILQLAVPDESAYHAPGDTIIAGAQ